MVRFVAFQVLAIRFFRSSSSDIAFPFIDQRQIGSTSAFAFVRAELAENVSGWCGVAGINRPMSSLAPTMMHRAALPRSTLAIQSEFVPYLVGL